MFFDKFSAVIHNCILDFVNTQNCIENFSIQKKVCKIVLLMQTDGENDSAQKYMPQLGEICTARSEMFRRMVRSFYFYCILCCIERERKIK